MFPYLNHLKPSYSVWGLRSENMGCGQSLEGFQWQKIRCNGMFTIYHCLPANIPKKHPNVLVGKYSKKTHVLGHAFVSKKMWRIQK